MKESINHPDSPFKILKLINGDDVICKISEEYTDALVVEYPMAIVKNQIMERLEFQLILLSQAISIREWSQKEWDGVLDISG